jgi:hypothetical protein
MSRVIAECLSDCRHAGIARTQIDSADGSTNWLQNSNVVEPVADREDNKHYGPQIIAACDFIAIYSRLDSSLTALRERPMQRNGFMALKTRTRQVRRGDKQSGYSTFSVREVSEMCGNTAVLLKGDAQQLRWFSNVIVGLHGDEYTQPIAKDPNRLSIVSEVVFLLYGIYVPGLCEELVRWRRVLMKPESLAIFSSEDGCGFGALRVLRAIRVALGAVEYQGRGTLTCHSLMRTSYIMDFVGPSIFSELLMLIFDIYVLCLREDFVGLRRGGTRSEALAMIFGEGAGGFGERRVLGVIPVALGAVEFQGRGTLHRHTLMWTSQAQSIGLTN